MAKSTHLPPEVAAKFEEVQPTHHTFVVPSFGRVDVRQLTITAAEGLVARNWPYLKKKPAPVAKPKKETTKKVEKDKSKED